MGIMNHNAIVATTWSQECADELWKWVKIDFPAKWQDLVLRTGGWVNLYHTFVVVPDGSKEGWTQSDEGDELRRRFVDRLSQDDYEDGSSPWEWVEVGFGEYGQKVLRGNCPNRFNDREYAIDGCGEEEME